MGSSNPDVLSFSNDMDRGVWAYIVATGDREAALRYMNYTKSIGYHLCPKTETHWEACSMRATYWPFARDVFEWLGLPLDHRKMKDYKIWIDTIYSPIEARLQPVTFQMILTAEHVYTLRKLKEKGAKIHNEGTYARIAKIIHKRDPENPFYDFLANGPNEGAAEKILRLCPTTKPEVPVVNGAPQYTEPANGPWEKGSGHYCIFMINAILGSAI